MSEIILCDECGRGEFTVLVLEDGTTKLECTNCPATKWGKPEGEDDE